MSSTAANEIISPPEPRADRAGHATARPATGPAGELTVTAEMRTSPGDGPAHTYFQFRGFPSASHASVCSTRRARVSSRLASAIHSTYSRR